MSTKLKVALAIMSLVGAFASGRWLAPTKVVTEVKTVEVEKKRDQKQIAKKLNKHKETKTTTVTNAKGESTTTTTVIEDVGTVSNSNETKTSDNSITTNHKEETTRDASKVTISALAGINPLSPGAPVYGAAVSKPILGPVAAGVWGLSSGVGGVSVGISF
jgi:hypothetical protein